MTKHNKFALNIRESHWNQEQNTCEEESWQSMILK